MNAIVHSMPGFRAIQALAASVWMLTHERKQGPPGAAECGREEKSVRRIGAAEPSACL